jgi:hypothetical protein
MLRQLQSEDHHFVAKIIPEVNEDLSGRVSTLNYCSLRKNFRRLSYVESASLEGFDQVVDHHDFSGLQNPLQDLKTDN